MVEFGLCVTANGDLLVFRCRDVAESWWGSGQLEVETRAAAAAAAAAEEPGRRTTTRKLGVKVVLSCHCVSLSVVSHS